MFWRVRLTWVGRWFGLTIAFAFPFILAQRKSTPFEGRPIRMAVMLGWDRLQSGHCPRARYLPPFLNHSTSQPGPTFRNNPKFSPLFEVFWGLSLFLFVVFLFLFCSDHLFADNNFCAKLRNSLNFSFRGDISLAYQSFHLNREDKSKSPRPIFLGEWKHIPYSKGSGHKQVLSLVLQKSSQKRISC